MKGLQFLAPALFLLALYACECEPLEPTVPPAPDTFVVADTSSEKYFIYLRFNRPVDLNSLIANETVIVDSGDISYIYSSDELLPSPRVVIEISVDNCTICPVTLTLLAKDGIGVRSSEGALLDGDYDGTPGGDFELSTVLVF
jgi:hypothetical protein